MEDSVVLSFEEVSRHNTNNDCWLIIRGKVYDVSKFMEEHPGGEDVMLNVTGKDATVEFEDIGHSFQAEGLMKDFYVGEIDKLTLPETTSTFPTANNHFQDSSSTCLLFVVALLILGVAFIRPFYPNND